VPILDFRLWVLNFRRPERKHSCPQQSGIVQIWRLLLLVLLICAPHLASAAFLQIEITPTFSGQTLQPASLRYVNSSGEAFSITRVSYLLSDFGFQRNDGSWLDLSNSVAWLDLEQNRGSLRLETFRPEPFAPCVSRWALTQI
jgi:hypothetical protein